MRTLSLLGHRNKVKMAGYYIKDGYGFMMIECISGSMDAFKGTSLGSWDPPSSGQCDPLCSVDETSSQEFEATYQPKNDSVKALVIFAVAASGAVEINQSWVASNQDLAMALLFGIGYASIIFKEYLALNKSGVGLLMAISLWVIRSIGAPSIDIGLSELSHAYAEVSKKLFFLLGAMIIVEIVDDRQGFKVFLLRKLVPPSEYQKLLGAVMVIAANVGGAWAPISEVTTTIL